MSAIIRGTTPTIRYTFSKVDGRELRVAILKIKQNNVVKIERDITSASIDEKYVEWILSQEETLSLDCSRATISLDWLDLNGMRGAGITKSVVVTNSATNEVIG